MKAVPFFILVANADTNTIPTIRGMHQRRSMYKKEVVVYAASDGYNHPFTLAKGENPCSGMTV